MLPYNVCCLLLCGSYTHIFVSGGSSSSAVVFVVAVSEKAVCKSKSFLTRKSSLRVDKASSSTVLVRACILYLQQSFLSLRFMAVNTHNNDMLSGNSV